MQEIIEVLEDSSEEIDTGTMELLHFLVQSLRDAKVAAAAGRGILHLIAKDERYRWKFHKAGVVAAVAGLHFFGSEMSMLAVQMAEVLELQEDPVDETWKFFTFSSENSEIQVSVKVKLSTANDATLLSSHGWRVWPGAQVLSQWLVSHCNLKETEVVEA